MKRLQINGKTYDIVTLDYETFYGKDYTLSGKAMNMSEYIRDPRFHIHGVGLKKNDARSRWFTGRNIELALREIDWSRTAMLCHNTAFDGFITEHYFGIVPAFYLDTLSMSRAVDGHHLRHSLDAVSRRRGLSGKILGAALVDTKDKLVLSPQEVRNLGAYCLGDCDLTYEVFWDMYGHMPDDELRLIDTTMRMFCTPKLYVDIPRVEAELAKEIGGKLAALDASGASVADLMSNPKFAKLLIEAGAKVPTKVSLTTGKIAPAFAKSDLDFQELAKSSNPKVAALCAARLKVKSTIGETRAVRFLEAGKDGMRLPILLNYCGAHTTRWSGGNKMNLQNLLRGGELRRSIKAALGYAIVVSDSAQIEARTLAWLANQKDVVEAFRNRRDIYSEFASAVYGRTITKKDFLERHVGKVCVLGLGYGMGWKKLQQTLAQGALGGPPIKIDDEMAMNIVNLYRRKNPNIVALWRKMDHVIFCMATGITGTLGPMTYGPGYIRLPNGLFLHYPELRGSYNDRGQFTDVSYLGGRTRTKIYGGLLTENCLAGDTLVLTDSGWKYLAHICKGDLVHDGVEFVSHGGLASKSIQECVTIDGVAMTADHEVLTNEGWRAASQNPQPYRPAIWVDSRPTCRAFGQAQAQMALSMRLWKSMLENRDRTNESGPQGSKTLMRMPHDRSYFHSAHNTRNEPPSGIRSMEGYARPMPAPDPSGLEELWRTWNPCGHRLEYVRGLLERYEGHVSSGSDVGTNRQQPRLLSTELPLGDVSRTGAQSARLPESEHPGTITRNGDSSVDALLPVGPRLVFDILNAGPRQRFVVLGTGGPFIVHNCVQALARVIVGEQILVVQDTLKIPVVTMSHDEIVGTVPLKQAPKALEDMIKVMSTPPAWAPDIPLAAEGGWDVIYSK